MTSTTSPEANSVLLDAIHDAAFGLVLKIKKDLKDCLSCERKFSGDRKQAWLGQSHLISNFEKKFGDQVKGLQKYKTPGTPGLTVVKSKDDNPMVSKEKQTKYCSGVGMLLYPVKHSRPDIANTVREPSKVLDGCTEASFQEILRVMEYVLDTSNMGLKITQKIRERGQMGTSVLHE